VDTSSGPCTGIFPVTDVDKKSHHNGLAAADRIPCPLYTVSPSNSSRVARTKVTRAQMFQLRQGIVAARVRTERESFSLASLAGERLNVHYCGRLLHCWTLSGDELTTRRRSPATTMGTPPQNHTGIGRRHKIPPSIIYTQSPTNSIHTPIFLDCPELQAGRQTSAGDGQSHDCIGPSARVNCRTVSEYLSRDRGY